MHDIVIPCPYRFTSTAQDKEMFLVMDPIGSVRF